MPRQVHLFDRPSRFVAGTVGQPGDRTFYLQASDDSGRTVSVALEKTQVQVRVVAQSVRRANDTELEALLFLNQYTIKGQGEDARTTYTPYRALLTMVHTDKGWLVDGVATK